MDNRLSRIIPRAIKVIMSFILILLLAVSLISQNVNAQSSASGGAEITTSPIISGNITATAVYNRSDNRFIGITDCRERLESGAISEGLRRILNLNVFFNFATRDIGSDGLVYQESCQGFAAQGLSIGDSFNPNETYTMFGPNDIAETSSINGVAVVRAFDPSSGKIVYIQANNGNYIEVTDDIAREIGCSLNQIYEMTCEIEDVDTLLSNKYSANLRSQPGAISTLTNSYSNSLTTEARNQLNEAIEKAKDISTNGTKCFASLDSNNKPIYYCLKDGKAVGPRGEALSEECIAQQTTRGRVYFSLKSDDDEINVCIPKEDSEKIDSLLVLNQQPGQTTGEDGDKEKSPSSLDLLFSLISNVVLILVWAVNFAIIGIFWLISAVFFSFLRINPASNEFISVAFEPWRVVVSIANLITLFAFLYTGFRYILGVKTKPISEFILNIIIVIITINFTLFASASFVNISQGIGDTFVGAYAASTGNEGDYWTVMFDNLLNGMRSVSQVRCGNKEAVTGGSPTGECKGDTFGLFPAFNGSDIGTSQAALIGEVTFTILLLYGIYVMWRAMFLALFRVVGLWMLMVTSPFALAAFYSPVPQLKKMADKWMEWFLNLTFFYPVFVLGLILVSLISKTFGDAVRNQSSFTSADGITALAAGTAGDPNAAAAKIITLVLAGVVSVGAFNLLLGFMSFFNKFMESAWDGIKKVAGGLNNVVSTGLRMAGKGAAAAADKGIKNEQGNIKSYNKELSDIDKQLQRKDISDATRSALQSRQTDLIKKKKASQAAIARLKPIRSAGEALREAGERLEYLPTQVSELMNRPKEFFANTDKYKQARIAKRDAASKFDWMMQQYEAGITEGIDPKYLQTIAEASSDPKKAKKLRNKFITDAYNSKIQTGGGLGSENAINQLNKLVDSARGEDGNIDFEKLGTDEKNQFVDLLSQNVSNPEVKRAIFQNADAQKLLTHAYDNRLLTEDAEKFIKKNPGLFGNDKKALNAAASLSEEDYRELNFDNVLFNKAFGEELFKRRVAAVGLENAIKEFKDKGALTGGLTSIGDRMAEAKYDGRIEKDDDQMRRAVKQVSSVVVGSGLEEETLIEEAMAKFDHKTGQISDSDMDAIFQKQYKKMFGGSTEAEIEAADFATLQQSNIGKLLAESEDYKAMTAERQTETLRVAALRNLENANISRDAYQRNIAGSAKVYAEAKLKEDRDTATARESQKILTESRKQIDARTRNKDELKREYEDQVRREVVKAKAEREEQINTEIKSKAAEIASQAKAAAIASGNYKEKEFDELFPTNEDILESAQGKAAFAAVKKEVEASVGQVDEVKVRRDVKSAFTATVNKKYGEVISKADASVVAQQKVLDEVVDGIREGQISFETSTGPVNYEIEGVGVKERGKIADQVMEVLKESDPTRKEAKKAKILEEYGSNASVRQIVVEGLAEAARYEEQLSQQYYTDLNEFSTDSATSLRQVNEALNETKRRINEQRSKTRQKVAGVHGDTEELLNSRAGKKTTTRAAA